MMKDAMFNFLYNNRGLPIRSMTVFNFLLEAALASAIMVVLVLVVRRFFRRQLGSRALCFAWLLIAIRLFVPLALPNPLMNELRPTHSIDAGARPVADQFRVRMQDAISDFAWRITYEDRAAWRKAGIPAGEQPYTAGEFISDFAAYTSYGWTGKWFLFAYMAIAAGVGAGFLGRGVHELYRLKKRRYAPLSEEDQQEYHAICQRLEVTPLPAYYVGSITGVRLMGLWRPYIAISSTLKSADTPAALLRAVASYQAGAHWWSLLRKVCCAVQWFNPFVWLGACLSRRDFILALEDKLAGSQVPARTHKLRRCFAACCCVVLLCSFFTAETAPPLVDSYGTRLSINDAHKIVCTVDGAEITLFGFDFQHTTANLDGFYGDPPVDAVSLEQAAAAALTAIQSEYSINPADFAAHPVSFGFYHNSESVTDPIIHWRIDLPAPAEPTIHFECRIRPDGTVEEILGPEEGNG